MATTHVPERFPELDLIRGIAVVMMLLFHIAFDLYFLRIAPVPVTSLPWRLFAISTAGIFLFVAGISLSISSAHARAVLSRKDYILKYLKRGAGILGIGLAITLVTWVLLPGSFIIFGILHLIGLAIILSPLYGGLSWQNLLAGTAIILLAPLVAAGHGGDWLIWLGIHPASFYSIDYTPVFPWLGIVLLGVYGGTLLYPGGRRRWHFPARGIPMSMIGFLGRHSLAVYIIHQPVILGILWLAAPEAFAPYLSRMAGLP